MIVKARRDFMIDMEPGVSVEFIDTTITQEVWLSLSRAKELRNKLDLAISRQEEDVRTNNGTQSTNGEGATALG
jgi:hypothetical protein